MSTILLFIPFLFPPLPSLIPFPHYSRSFSLLSLVLLLPLSSPPFSNPSPITLSSPNFAPRLGVQGLKSSQLQVAAPADEGLCPLTPWELCPKPSLYAKF